MIESKYSFPLNDAEIEENIQTILSFPLSEMDYIEKLNTIYTCIDNTTLEGSDTEKKIIALCEKSKRILHKNFNNQVVAAVCVYPVFVKLVKDQLQGTFIKTASVAGAFPAGQSPIEVKLHEVQYAIDQGADEIDMVISRGSLLEENYNKVYDEIAAIRDICKQQTLKVILETGELQTTNAIYAATHVAIEAGADFIKTSTGKISVNATEKAAYIILTTILDVYKKTGKKIGFKVSGGISTIEQAMRYYCLTENILNTKNIGSKYFRIGASRLTDILYEQLS